MGRRSAGTIVGPLDAFFKLCPGPAVQSQKQLASQPGDAPLKPTKRHRTKAPLEGWTASPSTKRPIATPQQSSPRPARPNPAKRVRGSGDSSSANRAAAARQADPVVVDHDSEGPPGLSDTDTDEEHDLAMLAKAAKPATRVARRATSGSTATSPSSANGAAPASSGPGGRPVVRSMNDLWHFADSNLSQTDDPCASAGQIEDAIKSCTSISTAFSGVCAETVAMNMINSRLAAKQHREIPHPKYLYAVDNDKDCQREASVLPHGPCCQFSSLESFMSGTLAAQIDTEPTPYDMDRLMAFGTAKGAVQVDAPCVRHPARKKCRAHRSDGHCGGLPCTYYTTWGSGRHLGGPTAVAIMIWLCMRRMLLEHWILVEEVPQFPVELQQRYLSEYYDICTFVLDNTRFGIPAKRLRRYVLLTLRTVCCLARPLSSITDWSRDRSPEFTWRTFLCAESDELYAEIHAARRRDGMPKDLPPLVDATSPPTREDYYASLLASEQVRLEDFIEHHAVDHSVCSLGQDPNYTRAASGEDVLHTLVRNPGLLWIEEFDRWLTVRETFMAQCFPMTNASLAWIHQGLTGRPLAMTSFNVSRLERMIRPRCRVCMMHQSGNTMNVVVVGSVLMHLFLYLRSVVSASFVSMPATIPSLHQLVEVDNDDESATTSKSNPKFVKSSMLDVWSAARSGVALSAVNAAMPLTRKALALTSSDARAAESTSASSVSSVISLSGPQSGSSSSSSGLSLFGRRTQSVMSETDSVSALSELSGIAFTSACSGSVKRPGVAKRTLDTRMLELFIRSRHR